MMKEYFIRGLAVSAALAAGVLFGQAPGGPAPASKLEFEVASIKAAPQITPALMQSGKMHIGMNIDGARVDIGGMPIMALLPQVFRVKQYQIAGAGSGTPDMMNFMNSDRWDIQAKLPEGATQDQVPDMLLTLLVDRFKLAYHRETKELPVYALVVAKGGTKLKDISSEPDAPVADDPAAVSMNTGNGQVRISQSTKGGGRGATISSPQFGTMKMEMGEDGAMHLEAAKITMAGLAELLTSFVDRPVVDMTEMKGSYQMTLELSMQDIMAVAARSGAMGGGGFGGPGGPQPGANATAPAASDPSGGAVFSAVQKLGLKLDGRKAPIETIVVDHLEKTPTEN
jgi:uncharacterized protein (TIGR03435 family)